MTRIKLQASQQNRNAWKARIRRGVWNARVEAEVIAHIDEIATYNEGQPSTMQPLYRNIIKSLDRLSTVDVALMEAWRAVFEGQFAEGILRRLGQTGRADFLAMFENPAGFPAEFGHALVTPHPTQRMQRTGPQQGIKRKQSGSFRRGNAGGPPKKTARGPSGRFTKESGHEVETPPPEDDPFKSTDLQDDDELQSVKEESPDAEDVSPTCDFCAHPHPTRDCALWIMADKGHAAYYALIENHECAGCHEKGHRFAKCPQHDVEIEEQSAKEASTETTLAKKKLQLQQFYETLMADDGLLEEFGGLLTRSMNFYNKLKLATETTEELTPQTESRQ